MRRVLLAAAIALAVTACGEGQPVFGTTATTVTTVPTSGGTGPTTTSPSTSTTVATTTTTTTTTLPVTVAALEVVVDGDFEPADPPQSTVGAPDTATAAAVAEELAAAGVGLTGVEIWILPIVGTGEQMLVFAVDASAEQLAAGDSPDLFEVLPTLPSLADRDDITRFTLHYYDTDEEGDFVLTTTLPLQVLFDYEGEELPEEQIGIQLQRLP